MKAIIMIMMMALIASPVFADEIQPIVNDVQISESGDETVVTAIVISGTEMIDNVYADVSQFADIDDHPLGYIQLDQLAEDSNIYIGRFTATNATDGYQPIPIHVTDVTGEGFIDCSCYISFEEPQEICSTPLVCDTPLLSVLILTAIFIASALYSRRRKE